MPRIARNVLALTSILWSANVALADPPPTSRPAPPGGLLAQVGESNPRVKEWQRRWDEIAARREDVEQQIARLRAELVAGTERVGATPRSVRAALDTLAAEQLKLEVDKVGLTARRDALTDAVARLSAEAEKQISARNAEVLAALEAQYKIRVEQVERTHKLHDAGAAPQAEVAQAEAALQEAKVQLSRERAASPARSPEYETLSSLNRQLLDAGVSLAEAVARLDFVTKQLKDLARAQPAIDRLESLERARLALEEQAEHVRAGDRP